MQIVIDIPEVYYEALKQSNIIIKGQRSGKTLESVIYSAVANGTPLPEHGRLIDIGKVEFVDVFPVRAYDKGWHNAVRLCVETLRNAPTVLEATKEGDGE